MVRNDDDLLRVPNLRTLSKFFFKDTEGARTADIMCEQLVHVGPDICTGLQTGVVGMLGKYLFRQRHCMLDLHMEHNVSAEPARPCRTCTIDCIERKHD